MLCKRIQYLWRELDRQFDDWNNMLAIAIKDGDRSPLVAEKTREYFLRRDMLKQECDELQRMLV